MAGYSEVIKSSLRADIEHAARQVREGNGDVAYWLRQKRKAQKRLNDLNNGLGFKLAEYCLDMVDR
jgi:hypothetical protein